ncbi:DUF1501 domain-containing protein [Sandaracinomonas limnophila]|uniref:DUF1501 domain-containing protein n=1 Tax=Sandaracinomonas limnophila TaxID=1862386 RepID=UPI001EEDD577|nr:DUF1501 domain-containing protein [Sandaracinomonas limnophila]
MKKINRKEFLHQISLLTGGMGMGLSNFDAKAYTSTPLAFTQNLAAGNVLVIIQMSGGNDGLNTVIPAEDDLYFSARPTISIKKEVALPVENGMYLHPSMTGLKKLFDDDKVSIVQNVGYANPNRSHFRATDIWNSASDSGTIWDDGWAGRYLSQIYPEFPIKLPKHPMAIQLGSVESLLFQSHRGGFATVFDDPNLFYQLVNGSVADNDLPPATLAGEELAFLKQIASASLQYSTIIKDTANKGKNIQSYPNTSLSKQLSIVAKLISGGLETPIYLANIGGFDTHANQINSHANLLKTLSDAITNFQIDIQNLGLADRVCVMTYSEFGRRVNQNGTAGTDHGTAAPMIFVGNSVKSGLIGSNPNLKVLDSSGDLKYQFDFRQTYTTVLRDHLGATNSSAASLFTGNFERLPIFKSSPDSISDAGSIDLANPWPNPASISTFIQYTVHQSQEVFLAIYDLSGKLINVLVHEIKVKGEYNVSIDVSGWNKGHYIVTLLGSSGKRMTKNLMIN